MASHTDTAERWVEGTRVRVRPHPFWPTGVNGTVRPFPTFATELCGEAEKPSGCYRTVQGAKGPLTMVWVVFDAAVRDGDDDGPYREGEILAEYLEVIEG